MLTHCSDQCHVYACVQCVWCLPRRVHAVGPLITSIGCVLELLHQPCPPIKEDGLLLLLVLCSSVSLIFLLAGMAVAAASTASEARALVVTVRNGAALAHNLCCNGWHSLAANGTKILT